MPLLTPEQQAYIDQQPQAVQDLWENIHALLQKQNSTSTVYGERDQAKLQTIYNNLRRKEPEFAGWTDANFKYHDQQPQEVQDLWARIHALLRASGSDSTVFGITDMAKLEGIYVGMGGEPAYSNIGVTDKPDTWSDQIGGTPQLWKDTTTGQAYIVYMIPGTDVPLMYSATTAEIKQLFGDTPVVYDRQYTTVQLNGLGALQGGVRAEISIDSDPFTHWGQQIDLIKDVVPWLQDPEVLGLVLQSIIEEVPITEEMFWTTKWWKEHNEQERAWLLTSASDPQTAQQILDDNESVVRQALKASGYNEPSDGLVDYMSRMFTTGQWSQQYYDDQLKAISDPYAGIQIDPEITKQGLLGTGGWASAQDITREEEDTVRGLLDTWLGPAFGGWSNRQIEEWAGKLRNNPDAQQELTEILKKQRLALFPEYTDPNASYQDIAQPWKQVVFQMWGEAADEKSGTFQNILKANDLAYAQKLLREQGIARGKRTVIEDAISGLAQASSGSRVRRPL